MAPQKNTAGRFEISECREMSGSLRVMSSLDESRSRFSGTEPLSERLIKEVRILSIAELFGGTLAFNHRALIGACGLLKQRRESGKPFDLIVLNGGALPEVPTRGSRGNRQKMEFLIDGIEDIDDSCKIMRRAFKKLIGASGKTPIAYVLGEEDYANIETITDRLIAESRKAENMAARIQSLREETSNIDIRLASMEEESGSLLRQLKSLSRKRSRSKKSHEKEEGLEERIRKLSKEVREIARKQSELIERKRRTENRITLLEDDLKNLAAVRRTNIEYLTPSETKEIKESAKKEYLDHLHRLFEGGNVQILSDNVSLLDVAGMRVALGHSLENTSRTAKKTALANREEMQSRMQVYGLLPKVDLFLFAHHPGSKGWALPQSYDDPNPLYLFQQGGFSDPKGLYEAYNRKIKTTQTEALDKYQLDSGLTLIQASKDGSLSFDMLGLGHLEQYARPILQAEHSKLQRRLSDGLTTEKMKPETDRKVIAQLSLEFPSKLSDEQLRIVIEGGIDPQRLFAPQQIRQINELAAEVHSDYHIGIGNPWDAHSNQEIMRAAIADSHELGMPELIVFGGDMVEGTLGSKANEVVSRNFLDEREFKRLLYKNIEEAGLGKLEFEKAMHEFYKRASYSLTVPNLDQQIHLLMPLLEHAAEVIAKGGEAIFISGNHYNQSHRDERLDEAIRLSSAVKMIGGFRENDPRMHTFYGGWIGSGQVEFRGIPIFGIHKARSSRDHVTGLMEHKTLQRREDSFLFIQGHHHDMAFGKTVSDVHVSAPSIAPPIPYVDQASLHGGLQGYTRLSLYVDQSGKHFESIKVMNRFLPQMEKHIDSIDPLFLDIFRKMVKKTAKS